LREQLRATSVAAFKIDRHFVAGFWSRRGHRIFLQNVSGIFSVTAAKFFFNQAM
jgi:hypothetical protein